ncbi:MAG: tRNA pseudouridine(55) synthase TruB [Bdellovibrionales bacterium]|nr:tRNA pseudouridine(55) synthase TruB [Bdellovibrionales bacterium]
MEKDKQPFNGVLLVHKEKGMTSHDVVDQLRKILKQRSIGHAGTLDPMAEGLLVILLGQATKLSVYILNQDKSYSLKMQFGLETDTFDKEGKVLKQEAVSLKKEEIEKTLKASCGSLELKVPHFSAVKVRGRKLYSYARAGEEVEAPKKTMTFYDLKIHDIQPDQAQVSLSCAKGGYVRSWVNFVGEQLGVGACLIQMTRTASHPFHSSQSLRVSEIDSRLKEKFPKDEIELKTLLQDSFIYPSSALPDVFPVELTQRDAKALSHGQIPPYVIQSALSRQIEVNKTGQPQLIQAVQDWRLSALLEIRPFKKMKIIRNFTFS